MLGCRGKDTKHSAMQKLKLGWVAHSGEEARAPNTRVT